MGVPKQKWTEEEEYALKSGVVKHGSGKWRTILKDPEFSRILYLRSNVDLKDKWRNLGSSASGWGTRERARIALRRSQDAMRQHDNNPMALTTDIAEVDDDIVDVVPLATASESLQIKGPKISFSRLDNLIFEAITCMKQPTGSNKTAIAMYIEDHYGFPLNLKVMLSAKLRDLTESGKLIKVKRHYRIAQRPSSSKGRSSSVLLLEERQRKFIGGERDDFKPLNAQSEADLARIRNMTAQDAAAAAAQAVAEAEAAISEAEEAVKEAEAAEAEAEAARAFAEAAMSTLRSRDTAKLVNREHMIAPSLSSQSEADPARIRNMTRQEAAVAAAQAAAKAEAASLRAEEAAREVDIAKAEAAEARTFAKAVLFTMRSRNTAKLMVRV